MASARPHPPDPRTVARRTERPAPGRPADPSDQTEQAEAGASPVSRRNAEAAHGERVGWQVVTLAGALNVAEAAQLLRVDPARIRQRLRDRTMYGLRVDGRSWRFAAVQFDEAGAKFPPGRGASRAVRVPGVLMCTAAPPPSPSDGQSTRRQVQGWCAESRSATLLCAWTNLVDAEHQAKVASKERAASVLAYAEPSHLTRPRSTAALAIRKGNLFATSRRRRTRRRARTRPGDRSGHRGGRGCGR